MKVINLQEYRKTKRIQGVSAREIYKEAYKEKLRQRLRERMRLEELKEKQSEPPTKKTPI
ncbi:MAG TPA: hypothetical protein VMW09_04875 [Desulfatiglandales bacterium]|nr:hypothetical protein [Desulfatiglandales bacterium]